jgi:hypothetical protein
MLVIWKPRKITVKTYPMEDALRLAEEPEGGGPCLFLSMPSR